MTENTLIRVAVDLVLTRTADRQEIADLLAGHPGYPRRDVARLDIVPGKIVNVVLRRPDPRVGVRRRPLATADRSGSGADARLHLEYGYLQECHGRNSIRAAVGCYERAIELDPGWDKPHYQLILALSALVDSQRAIDLYKKRLAASPDQIREYRFLANACLRNGAIEEAGKVIAAGRKLEPDDDMLLSAEAELLDASGRRQEALSAWRALKQRAPDDLSPYFMSAFTLEALGRYQEAAAEWRYIISWLEAHNDTVHTTWPKEMLEGIEAKLAATDADVNGNNS